MGFHTMTQGAQTCTFQGPSASNTTEIPRKDAQREHKECNFGGSRKNTARNSTLLDPHSSGTPTLLGPLCGTDPSTFIAFARPLPLRVSLPLFLRLPLGRRPLKNPFLPFLTIQNVKSNLQLISPSLTSQKSKTNCCKTHRYLKKKPRKHHRNSTRRRQ